MITDRQVALFNVIVRIVPMINELKLADDVISVTFPENTDDARVTWHGYGRNFTLTLSAD